jgi:hypothetical protein
MDDWLDLLKEVPSLRNQDFSVVSAHETMEIVGRLQALGFKLYKLEGLRIADETTFFDEAARALSFPDGYVGSWNAFIDYLSEIETRPDRRVVILWQDAHRLHGQNVQVFLDAVFHLRAMARAISAYRKIGPQGPQIVVLVEI